MDGNWQKAETLPRVLVLWEDSTIGRQEAVEAVNQICHMNCRARLCLRAEDAKRENPPPAANAGDPVFEDDPEKLALQQSLILLPMLTGETLNRIVDLETSDLFVAVVTAALCRGIRTGVLRTAIDPRHGYAAPEPLARKIDRRAQLLQSFGIELVDNVCACLSRGGQTKEKNAKRGRIITEQDLMESISAGLSEVCLSPGDRLTPLAYDLVRERGLRVIKSRQESDYGPVLQHRPERQG